MRNRKNHIRLYRMGLLLMVLSLLTGCGTAEQTIFSSVATSDPELSAAQPADDLSKVAEDVQELMGTVISVRAYGTAAKAGVAKAFARAEELEQIFSPTIPASEINKVNAAAKANPGTAVGVSETFGEVLERALHISELTDGALDCSMGELIALWGIGTASAHLPAASEIQNHLLTDGWKQVHYDKQTQTVTFDTKAVELHFGAIAKGYISDEMKRVLLECGVTSAVMSLGGNVMTLGTKPDGSSWTVAITDPFIVSGLIASVRTIDGAVVTSGNYEKYFEQDGVRYHHILDPKTGYPSTSDVVSTTILSENGMDCDALSTATYILGSQRGMELIEQMDGYEAVMICTDGTILTSSHMEDYSFQEIH